MQIERKEKYTLIHTKENSFDNFLKEISNILQNFENEDLILEISNFINFKEEDFSLLLDVKTKKNKNGTSFVIVNKNVSIDNLPESLNIAPTITEAEDILEIEAIERELGF